jgi:hypothetical protein
MMCATGHPAKLLALLNARTAALDNDDQHDNSQHTSNNPNNHVCVHHNSFFFLQDALALCDLSVTWQNRAPK